MTKPIKVIGPENPEDALYIQYHEVLVECMANAMDDNPGVDRGDSVDNMIMALCAAVGEMCSLRNVSTATAMEYIDKFSVMYTAFLEKTKLEQEENESEVGDAEPRAAGPRPGRERLLN